MQRTATLLLLALLSGCTLSGALKSDAVSYDDVIEETTDKFLVVNILRARDKAPLHFSDIPLIHESLQATASLSPTVPFGSSPAPSSTRKSATATVSVQSSPTFDLNHLDTKDFVTGIASPIDAKFVKYWLDRRLDPRIVLFLFFSSVDIIDTQNHVSIRIENAPRDSIPAAREELEWEHGNASSKAPPAPCRAKADFQRYMKLINQLPHLYAMAYTERQVVADDVAIKPGDLADFLALDQSKFDLAFDATTKKYTIYALSAAPKIALCSGPISITRDAGGKTGPKRSDLCARPLVDISSKSRAEAKDPETKKVYFAKDENSPTSFCSVFDGVTAELAPSLPAKASATQGDVHRKYELQFNIRSVGEMIQFLGDLLAYQDAIRPYMPSKRLNDPVTLNWCGDAPANAGEPCSEGGVLFTAAADPLTARFSGTYRTETFAIANSSLDDHSLEVLSVLHQLVDLNKSATDVKTTPFVQVIP